MSVTIEITVFPASGRQECRLDKAGRIKVYVRSAAERGKANDELVRFLAGALNCSKDDVEIIQGTLARKKIIKIHRPFCLQMIYKALGLEEQTGIFGKKGE